MIDIIFTDEPYAIQAMAPAFDDAIVNDKPLWTGKRIIISPESVSLVIVTTDGHIYNVPSEINSMSLIDRYAGILKAVSENTYVPLQYLEEHPIVSSLISFGETKERSFSPRNGVYALVTFDVMDKSFIVLLELLSIPLPCTYDEREQMSAYHTRHYSLLLENFHKIKAHGHVSLDRPFTAHELYKPL